MDFKAIEKRVPKYVQDYIKDNCYEKKFVGKKIIEIEKTATSTKYESKYFYKNVLNESKYKDQVREYYLSNMAPKEKIEKPEKQSGKNITIGEFFQLIFRNHFEFRRGEKDKKGRGIYVKSFLFNIDPIQKTIEDKKVIRDLKSLQQKVKRYGYFTPNMFISHKFFTKEMLTLMGVIMLDFDLDTAHKVMTKEEVKKYIEKKLKITPNIIWDTKTEGNYQCAILIDKMSATMKSVHLYEQIVKEIIHELGDVVDEACYNANHIFSKPSNNRRKSKSVRLYTEKIYNIDDFRWLLNKRDKRREKERKIVDFKEANFIKESAIQALFDGQVSWRNHACFTLGLIMRWLGKTEDETLNFILGEWILKVNNSTYDHRFTQNEARNCVKHAFSGKYKCFHSKWVEIVTGIECNLTGYFRWKTYENQGIYKMDTKECLIKFFKENNGQWVGTKSELATLIGAKSRTIDRVMAQMKEKGELIFETKRGKGAKTTYNLVQQMEFDRVLELGYESINDEMNNLDHLINEIESLHA